MNKYYTGIGRRSTPKDILKVMRQIAYIMAKKGHILRSGGAEGADTAFADGWSDALVETVDNMIESACKAEIYLPWEDFNDQCSSMEGRLIVDYTKAKQLVSKLHPAWNKLSDGVKTLHARNMHQVLGKDLNTPSSAVIYWAQTLGNDIKGGTSTAVKLAKQHNIPTYNLYNEGVLYKWQLWIEKNKETK